MTAVATSTWTAVCDLGALVPDRGVCALVDGRAVAVFLLSGSGELCAIDNHDPFTDASVLSRGLVGVDACGREEPYVASPLRKHRFALRTGVCLDDPTVRLGTHDVRTRAGVVEVGPRRWVDAEPATGSPWGDGAETPT